MDRGILRDLVDRCGTSRGRDPWLNRDIEVAVGRGRDCDDSVRQKDAYAMPLHRSDYYVPPNYSTSLDAAYSLMKLLPKPVAVYLRPITEPPAEGLEFYPWNVALTRLEDEDRPQGWNGWAHTPALALCQALLRAVVADLNQNYV